MRGLPGSRVLGLTLVVLSVFACQGELRLDDDAGSPAIVPDAHVADAVGDGVPRTACSTDADCHLGTLHCDTVSGTCVACVSDQDCTTGSNHRCDGALHQCVQCGVDGDCATGQVCVTSARRCATSCHALTDCVLTGYVCDPTRSICIRCFDDPTCIVDPDTPVCATDGTCVQCTTDAQCPSTSPRCNQVTSACVACISSDDCPSTAPSCDPATSTCKS